MDCFFLNETRVEREREKPVALLLKHSDDHIMLLLYIVEGRKKKKKITIFISIEIKYINE